MTRSLRTAAIALILFVVTPALSAARQSFEDAHTAARTALVGRLLTLAQWCHDSELFEERDRAWHSVLEIETDNMEARKGLRYARNADGSWKDPAPRPAKNRNPAALEKLPAKRAETIGPFRDDLLARMEKEPVSPETKKAVLTEILAVDPDDEAAHKAMGEARLDDKWVLAETATGKARRAAIRTAVEAAAKAAPANLKASTPSDEDKVLLASWKCATESDNVRVVASGDPSQCESLATACRVTAAAFETALGTPASWAEGFGLYVATGTGEKDALVSHIQGIDDTERGTLKRTIGGGIPHTWKIVLFEPDPKRLLDCGVRHALAHLLFRSFKLTTANAWVFEGFGLYLTREICGTRLTWFCSGKGVSTEGKNSPRGKLMVATSNWMNEALQILTKEPAPDLGKVFEHDLATMGVDDLLISYALAAYIVEGRPETAPVILKSIGDGTASAEALHTALGMSIPELQQRLVQWLKERK